MIYQSISTRWTLMEGKKSDLMRRVERLASLTLPHVCLPLGLTHENTAITYTPGSIGAQLVTHIVNKLGLTLFRPGIPFFRLRPDPGTKGQLQSEGKGEPDIAAGLAAVEKESSEYLDTSGQRPKLTTVMEHLVVAGNALLVMEKNYIRCLGLRYWCAKRNYKGEVICIIIKEEMCADELELKVREAMITKGVTYQDESKVCWFKVVERKGNEMILTQYIGDTRLPQEFDGKWPVDECPYRIAVWSLPDESDYGVSLCQSYWGDLETATNLGGAINTAGIIGCEMRWGVDPTGTTRAEDLNTTPNGAFVPARKDDINPIFGGNSEAVTVADAILQRVERRLGAGFLMQGASTRNAERVTAEEVRMQALELETSYGGTYTSISRDVQSPVAHWCLDGTGNKLKGTGFEAQVITGLDALSRNAELEAVRASFSDLGMTAQLPLPLQQRIKWQSLTQFVGAGRGAPNLGTFIMDDASFQQQQQQEQNSAVSAQSAINGSKVAATQAAQQVIKQ